MSIRLAFADTLMITGFVFVMMLLVEVLQVRTAGLAGRWLQRGGLVRTAAVALVGVVLSDFSETGFAVVSRLHREGGIEHPRRAVTLDMACAALAQGWRLAGRVVRNLQEVASFDLPAGRPQAVAVGEVRA